MSASNQLRIAENDESIDIAAVRADFPALKRFKAYLDTAFVGLMPRQVKEAHEAYLEERFEMHPLPPERTILGIWMERRDVVRRKLAAFLGANEREIAFTLCTGCGINTAVNGLDWHQGDNVVSDNLEYPIGLHVVNALKGRGVEVRIARHVQGRVAPEQIEALVDKKTRAVVISHVSFLNGYRHELRRIAEIIHSRGGYLIVDASQSIGGIQVNARAEQVDVMAGIPYKWLCGANGLGFFYIREELIPLFPPDRLGWSSVDGFTSNETLESGPLAPATKRYEYGTLSFEGIYALDAALDYFNRLGMERIERRNLRLVERARAALEAKGYTFITPPGNQAPILSFRVEDEKALLLRLKEQGFYASSARRTEPAVRISPQFYNTEDEIDAFVDALPGK